MNILITGIDGYIGTILGDYLINRGHQVTGLDTGYYKEGWLYDGVRLAKNIIKKDVRKVEIEDLQGFESIIHLAELSNDPLGQNNPELTFKINHLGTMRLAKIAKKAGVKRFIYSSSCSVYGASNSIADETSPVNPLTAYAKCKILNEQALTEMADERFSPVFLRNSTVYGLSPRLRFDLVINYLCGMAVATNEIAMDSTGLAWRPFVHIKDVAKAISCALEAPKDAIYNQIFNVGNPGSNYQIRTIAEEIKKEMPACNVSLNQKNADKRNYRVSFDKINTMLPGFACEYSVATGIKELLVKFQELHLTNEAVQSRLYTRLKQIEYLKKSGRLDDEFFWKEEI